MGPLALDRQAWYFLNLQNAVVLTALHGHADTSTNMYLCQFSNSGARVLKRVMQAATCELYTVSARPYVHQPTGVNALSHEHDTIYAHHRDSHSLV